MYVSDSYNVVEFLAVSWPQFPIVRTTHLMMTSDRRSDRDKSETILQPQLAEAIDSLCFTDHSRIIEFDN